MNLEHFKTDILILGAGGAGLFAALHAHKANPDLDITIVSKGLLGKCGCTRMVQGGYNVALNPGELGRAPFHGHDRRRQMAAASGAGLDARDHGHRARARAGKRDRLLLRPQSGRHAARQGVRRPDLRSHRAQGRSHRHRDHQPADGAGLGAASNPPAGRASRRRAHPGRRRRACRRAAGRRAHRRVSLRRRASGAAGDRRRPDHVPLSHAVRRQEHGRPRHGAARSACRCATWRWCSSIRPAARRAGHAHDRHRAGRGFARLRRTSAQRRDAPLHGRLRPKLERATRDVVSRAIYAEMRAGRTTPNGGVYIKMGHLGPAQRREGIQGHGGSLPRLRLRSRRRPGRSGADRALFHGRRDLRGRHRD